MNKKKFLRKQLVSKKIHKYAIAFMIGVLITFAGVIFSDHYVLQSPVLFRSPIRDRFISPIGKNTVIEMVRKDTIEDFSVSPTPTIAPTPRVSPKKAPQLHSLVPVAYAAEIAYPYESKIAYMDQGQKDVMGQVEQTLGKAYAELIFRESGFHPLSINSSSGACGLGQFLPCSKLQCELTDINCQLNVIKHYVERRYTNIENALLFHNTHNYY